MRNAYQDLELPNFSSMQDIKRKYRSLALTHHPDRNGGDDKRMKILNEAYEFLQKNKTRYDQELQGHSARIQIIIVSGGWYTNSATTATGGFGW